MTVRGRHEGRAGADAVLVGVLAAGSTAAEAAEAARVSERTVRRRLGDADFASRVEAARAEMLAVALARLSSGAVAAVDTLRALMTPDGPPSVRLASAKAVLDFGIRLRAESQVAERLAIIEEHLGIEEKGQP